MNSGIFLNEREIYLATMDVIRRMQLIAEVLRNREYGEGTPFGIVRNNMTIFLNNMIEPLNRFVEENPRLFKQTPEQPYDDYC